MSCSAISAMTCWKNNFFLLSLSTQFRHFNRCISIQWYTCKVMNELRGPVPFFFHFPSTLDAYFDYLDYCVYQCRWRCLWPNSMVLFAHKTFAKKIRQHHRTEHQQEFSCRNEKAFVQFTMKSPDVNCIDTWRVGKYKYLYTKCVHFRAIQWCLYKSWTSRWRTKTFQNFLVLAK